MIFDRIKNSIDESYVRRKASETSEKDLSKAVKNEKEIDEKINNASVLRKYAEIGKLLLNMLKDYKNGVYRNVPWFTVASIVFCLLYVLNPFDLVPDFIPGIGYVDDMAVFTVALRFAETDVHNYLDWKLKEIA